MKTKLLAMVLMAGSTMFAGVRFGVGVGIGVPVAPVVVAQPPCPGPGYSWINGAWVAPYVAPYYGGRYVGHYWGGHPVYRGGYAHGGYARGFRR